MRRFLPAVLFSVCAVSTVTAAAADDKQACMSSSEKAQRLRMDGKLAEARKELIVCSREVCPAVVRSDCNVWLDQVTALLPSVVIAVRDEKGSDVVDVQVTMDGQRIADKLDGKAIVVPTGEHTFKVDRDGNTLEQKVLIREGEKARQIDFKFGGGGSGSGNGSGTGTGGKVDVPPVTSDGGGHTIPPWVVFGLGAAAATTGVIIYFVGRNDVPAQCDFGSRTCAGGTPTDTLQQASSATGTANAGIVIAIVGGVIAVGGLVWHFVEPTGPSHPNATSAGAPSIGLRNVSPIFGPNFTGAGFSAAF